MDISEIIFDVTSVDLSNIFSLIIQSTITIFSVFFVVSMFLMENEKYKNSSYSKLILSIKCKINYKMIVFVSCIVVLLAYISILFNTFYEYNNDFYNRIYALISASCIILFILLMIELFYCFYQLYKIYNLSLLEDIEQENPLENIKNIEQMIAYEKRTIELEKAALCFVLIEIYLKLIPFLTLNKIKIYLKNMSIVKSYFKEGLIPIFKSCIISKVNIIKFKNKLRELNYLNKKRNKILKNKKLSSCHESEMKWKGLIEELKKEIEVEKEEINAQD